MVIRSMSELFCQTGLDVKPSGGGTDVFLDEVDNTYHSIYRKIVAES